MSFTSLLSGNCELDIGPFTIYWINAVVCDSGKIGYVCYVTMDSLYKKTRRIALAEQANQIHTFVYY